LAGFTPSCAGIFSKRTVEIVALVVDSRFRNAGHGRALVERAEQWAVSIGAQRIRVRSNVTERTAPARRLCARQDIARVRTRARLEHVNRYGQLWVGKRQFSPPHLHVVEPGQVPQLPPQKSLPQTLKPQSGVQHAPK
jgi:GNAT superfamily N-acetyltransferase